MLFPCTVIAVAHHKDDYIHAYLMLTLSTQLTKPAALCMAIAVDGPLTAKRTAA